MTNNWLQFIFDFFDKIVSMFGAFKSFLLSSITIFDVEISVWALLGGGLLLTVLIAMIIKAIL